MSTIKNGQILLFCHFDKIVKEPEANFQSPAFNTISNHTEQVD